MKPIYLKMKAFGSYKEEYIDFSKVQQGVFLITGDTGAGKTTIFDAITYALYGESSGGKRDSKMMVSQFASSGEYTEVEFAFLYGKDTYKIKRAPEQPKYKEKKQEDGTVIYEQLKTTRKPEVELTLPNGEIYIGKLNETNKKIQEIIGIDASQFTQIAMLAQGDFLKLLHAKSDERKEIFSKIFDTHFYYQIEKEIETCYKNCENALKENEKEIETCLTNIVCSKDSAKKEEWENKGTFSIDRKEEIFQLIKEIQKEYEDLSAKNKETRLTFEKKRDTLQKSIHDAQIVNKDFTDLKLAKEKRDKLEQQKDEIEENRNQVKKGEKALKIAGSYSMFSDKRTTLLKKTDTVEQLQKEFTAKKEQLEPLEKKKQETQKRYEEEFSKKIEEYSRLEEKLKLYEEIGTLQAKYNEEKETQIKKEKLQKKKEQQKKKTKEKADTIKKEIEELSNLAEKRDAIQIQIEKLSREQEDLEEFLKLLNTGKDTQKQLEKQQKKKEKAEKTEQDAEEHYNTLYQNFIHSQAHVLRATLIEGEPCPVCGSVHHVAMPDEEIKIVNQEEVEQAKELYEAKRKLAEKEKEKFQKLTIQKEENERQLAERREKLGLQEKEISIKEMEKTLEHLSEELENNRTKKDEADHATKALEKSQQKQKKNEKTLEETEQELSQLEKDLAALQTSTALKAESLSEKKSLLPYPTKEETKKHLRTLKTQQQKLESEKKSAEELFLETSDKVKKLEATLETEKQAKENLEKEKETAEKNFLEQLETQGFSSEKEFLESRLPDDTLENLKNKIAEYESLLRETNTNIALLTERTSHKKEVDVTQYQKNLVEVQRELEELEKQDKEIYSQKQANQKAKDSMEQKYKELEEHSIQYNILKSLHDTANGKLSKKRIDFQTYIQRHYFKQVIHAANQRLTTMSNNQFILQCRKLEDLGSQGNVGLDIDVYSMVNDQTRDVKTLSGGESFMAALSMALGLSDIIQSKAGKIKIDTMFIDEGFGSLSDDTRNQALGLLHELSEGNRLIGIISHVSELKTQVDTRLVVTKTSLGSKARWN